MKKQVHKESQIQGSKAQFAEVTAGIQMTMLIKMANSFQVFVNNLHYEVYFRRQDGEMATLTIQIKADAQGKGTLTFTEKSVVDHALIEKSTVYKLGGVYAFIEPGASGMIPGFVALDYVVALNTAILGYREKFGEQVAS